MKTRSQSKNTQVKRENMIVFSNIITRSMNRSKYEFVFDFDDSMSEWRKNKTSTGNGSFMYKKVD